jgi:hypothetical protein
VIEVKRGWRKARFRIMWVGAVGSPYADEIGILCLEDKKDIWSIPDPGATPTNRIPD